MNQKLRIIVAWVGIVFVVIATVVFPLSFAMPNLFGGQSLWIVGVSLFFGITIMIVVKRNSAFARQDSVDSDKEIDAAKESENKTN